jgi:hypothetical protein
MPATPNNAHALNPQSLKLLQASDAQRWTRARYCGGADHGVDSQLMRDWSECPEVERCRGKVSGAWLFRAPASRSRRFSRIWRTVPRSTNAWSGFLAWHGVRSTPSWISPRPVSSHWKLDEDHFRSGHSGSVEASPSPRSVETAAELGWSGLVNGDLLAAAEGAGFDLMITTDQSGVDPVRRRRTRRSRRGTHQ